MKAQFRLLINETLHTGHQSHFVFSPVCNCLTVSILREMYKCIIHIQMRWVFNPDCFGCIIIIYYCNLIIACTLRQFSRLSLDERIKEISLPMRPR